MSGRRIYSRFRSATPRAGQIRISRNVAVQVGETPSEINVLSDAPGVVDEELTLALVSSAGAMDLRVRVVDSRPQIIDGVVRHRVRLQLLAAETQSGDDDRSAQK